jgi:hypothetical protein
VHPVIRSQRRSFFLNNTRFISWIDTFEEEEMYVITLLEEKCLQQVNLCYRPEAKMVAINNIEIFGSVCRETNPSSINIKREKDKQPK